jgi:hypothetical protein
MGLYEGIEPVRSFKQAHVRSHRGVALGARQRVHKLTNIFLALQEQENSFQVSGVLAIIAFTISASIEACLSCRVDMLGALALRVV